MSSDKEEMKVVGGIVGGIVAAGLVGGAYYYTNRCGQPKDCESNAGSIESQRDDRGYGGQQEGIMPSRDEEGGNEIEEAGSSSGIAVKPTGPPSPEDMEFQQTLQNAVLFFPGLISVEWRPLHRKLGPSPSNAVKIELIEKINGRMDVMDEGGRQRLMKRENAEELCLVLGMNKTIVEVKFKATRKFEEELGFKGKMPILDSIFHLVETINVDNPFGRVNDLLEESYQQQDWLSYMGLNVPCGNLQESVESVQDALEAAQIEESYMHGTTAAALQLVFDENGSMFPRNFEIKFPHDFGQGTYCFRAQLKHALSFAFDRSWPYISSFAGGHDRVSIKTINKFNPALVIFPNGKCPRNQTFQVGVDAYPYGTEDLKKRFRISQGKIDDFEASKRQWNENDTKEVHQWKHFVKLARTHGVRPHGCNVYLGLLHDCNSTKETDKCKEPKPDADGWVQYCFKYGDEMENENLGLQRVFVEFFIDWVEWCGKAEIEVSELMARAEENDQWLSVSS